MFNTRYVPVNIKSNKPMVYSYDCEYPVHLLERVSKKLLNDSDQPNVHINSHKVTFDDNDYTWIENEALAAYQAYQKAVAEKYSFMVIKDNLAKPHLFVNKVSKVQAYLVDGCTMRTVTVTNAYFIKKLMSMVDGCHSPIYLQTVFDMARKLEKGTGKFAESIILYRNEDLEFMAMNPFLCDCPNDLSIWETAELKKLQALSDGNAVEGYTIDATSVTAVDRPWKSMSIKSLHRLLSTYNHVVNSSSDYCPFVNDDNEPLLYVSTNERYLVNAETLETLVINNLSLKRLLLGYLYEDPHISKSEASMFWQLGVSANENRKTQ